MQFYVLPNQPNLDARLFPSEFCHHCVPALQFRGLFGFQLQAFQKNVRDTRLFENQRDFIKQIRRHQGNHRFLADIAKLGNFAGEFPFHRIVAAGKDHIRHDTHRAQFTDGMLGGFGFRLVCGAQVREPGDVHKSGIFAPKVIAQFPNGFEERLTFDIPDRSADFDQGDIRFSGAGQHVYPPLDLVGNMRNDLDCAAEVIPAAFAVDHFLVDLPGRDGAGLFEVEIAEAFIVPQVQVGLRAIIQHKNFTVLVGAQCAGIHIEVRVQLLDSDLKAPGFEQPANRSGSDSLAHRGNHTPSKENDLCRHQTSKKPCH